MAQQVTVAREGESFFSEPGGVRLARLSSGLRLGSTATRAGHVQVTLEGWIFAPSVRRVRRDGHTLQVSAEGGENLRSAPSGQITARLVSGALLDSLERRGGWIRVRRTGWVQAAGVGTQQAGRGATPRPQAPAPGADSLAARPDPRRAVVRRRLSMLRTPGGDSAGALEPGTPVRITARAGGWVRVEAQGWVRESEVRATDQGILTGVSAAELRTTPEEFRGKLLRWSIQYVALQTADDLRPDFVPGQRFMLARGPAPEYAFVYIIVPDDKLADVRRLEPLTALTIVARVVNGRSTYLANPILELVDLGQ